MLMPIYTVYRRNSWQPLKNGVPIEQGEWVRIDLEIMSPVVRRFVAVTDPTPAGLEPVDQSLASAIPGGAVSPVRWWNAFNQRALSNEQSMFYAEWLSAESHTVTYYARAKFAGEFMALPAKVESMYSDGVFATTEPVIIRVESTK
jgi:alpha-2-macroglobulin